MILVVVTLIVVLALFIVFTAAAIGWTPKYDSTPLGQEPQNWLAQAIFWWSDVLWVFRAWWGWTCPHCVRNMGSVENLAQHITTDEACSYYYHHRGVNPYTKLADLFKSD